MWDRPCGREVRREARGLGLPSSIATTKRLLDATARELAAYTRDQKLAAIRGKEGRTLASETIATAVPLVHDVSNPELAASQGADLLVLNVSDVDASVVAGLPDDPPDRVVREAVGEDVIFVVGKMHASGSVGEAGASIVDDATIAAFVAAGADIVLLPAPGTVPGCHEAQVRNWVTAAQRAGALTMTAVGTSQEGADVDTIRRIALMAKMTGTDVHHLGDCGYYGITLPENLFAYSIAIRGRRHTYRRMAMSIAR